MSNREFTEWFIYSRKHPFGERREDVRAGIQWAATINPHLKKADRVTAEDYPLIKASETEVDKAAALHNKFAMFKKKREHIQAINADNLQRRERVGT